MNDKKTDYKSAGVNIEAGNEAVNLIKEKVKSIKKVRFATPFGGISNIKNIKAIKRRPFFLEILK